MPAQSLPVTAYSMAGLEYSARDGVWVQQHTAGLLSRDDVLLAVTWAVCKSAIYYVADHHGMRRKENPRRCEKHGVLQ